MRKSLFEVPNMAEEKPAVDVGEFEKVREQIVKDEEGEDWKLAKTFEHTSAYRRISNDAVFKFVSKMAGIPPEDCVKLITDLELRARYDKAFTEIKLLEDAGEYRTIYWYTPLPFPCSHRDLVQNVKVITDEASKTTYVVALNATHPDAPERPKIVRAETLLSCIIVRPDEKDPKSSVVTIISHTDMKGLLPEFVVKGAILSSGDTWRASVVKFYHEVYLKEKQ